MPKLTFKCSICAKDLVLVKELTIGTARLNSYKCGHVFAKQVHKLDRSTLQLEAVDFSGKKARPYQAEGVEFIINSDFQAIIGDQMRLGKTPQVLLALRNSYLERTPCLILVRGANLWQWIREYKTWTDPLLTGIFPIISSNAWIATGFKTYIVSMDTFSRPKVLEQLKLMSFKLVIADECHSFKNTDSNRSQALVDFLTVMNTGEETLTIPFTCTRCKTQWMELGKRTFDKRIGHVVTSKSARCPNTQCGQWCYVNQSHTEKDGKNTVLDPKAETQVTKLIALGNDQSTTEPERQLALTKAIEIAETHRIERPKPCGFIGLSGTVIKNRAEETFIPLNLVAPDKVHSLESYRKKWLSQDDKGKWSHIKSYRLEEWKRFVSPYMLRREWSDVYSDIPKLNRTFTVIQPEKGVLTLAYNKILDKMNETLANKVNPTFWDMAESLMELRRICGLMKVPYVSDYVNDLVAENGGQRYAIGLHHEAVRDSLFMSLGGADNCLKLDGSSTTSAESKDRVMRTFETSKQKVLLLGMIAGGVGMDFHYCDNVIILERAWSAADEDQFEARFQNPDKSIKDRPTNVEYILIKDSIEAFFYDLIEEKRKIFGETLSTQWSVTDDRGSFKDLVERTIGARL